MADGYLTETLTYGELVEKSNEIGNRLFEAKKLDHNIPMPDPPKGFESIEFTIRIDPAARLTHILLNMYRMGDSDFEGMQSIWSSGLDREATLKFRAYYSTVSKCVQMESVKTSGEWATELESDTPKAEALHNFMGMLAVFYQWQIIDAEGK